MPRVIVNPVPHGRTARRVTWDLLPPAVRSAVEARTGSPVVGAESAGAGYTPGFASVLTCADGSRHFVKAASTVAQRMFAEAYATEARTLEQLPAAVPAARLRWHDTVAGWTIIALEHVPSRQPVRPWSLADLDATLDALEQVADALTPPPTAMAGLPTFAEEMTDLSDAWGQLDVGALADAPELAGLAAHAGAAHGLAAGFAEVTRGDTVVHTDVRDDNVLIREDGTALLCDWNWVCRGAAWIDSLVALLGPRGDGIDVEAVIARRRLLTDVPPDHVDALLALLVGYFLRQSTEPSPATSPHLRDSQRWQGTVLWDWLRERRGWR